MFSVWSLFCVSLTFRMLYGCLSHSSFLSNLWSHIWIPCVLSCSFQGAHYIYSLIFDMLWSTDNSPYHHFVLKHRFSSSLSIHVFAPTSFSHRIYLAFDLASARHCRVERYSYVQTFAYLLFKNRLSVEAVRNRRVFLDRSLYIFSCLSYVF